MRICFRVGKEEICYGGPILQDPPPGQFPKGPKQGVQTPGVYSELFADAAIIESIHAATKNISDDGVRHAVRDGINAAVQALKRRGGEHVASVTLEDEGVRKAA
jgi:hypothetical protein